MLRSRGIRVPEDVSVVGFCDLPHAADFGLTTVNVPHLEMGHAAARPALQGRGSAIGLAFDLDWPAPI